jgi:hypothetical protein
MQGTTACGSVASAEMTGPVQGPRLSLAQPTGPLRLPAGVCDLGTADTSPGACGALAPPLDLNLAPVQYRALIRSRYRQHPGARQHLLADARRLASNAHCPALLIVGRHAREARAILRALADRGRCR